MEVPTVKVICLNFNLNYEQFSAIVLPLIHAKARQMQNPANFDPENLSLKYVFIPNCRLSALSDKPLALDEYCDLDDESDYDALQLEIRRLASFCGRRSTASLDTHTLQLHASIVKRPSAPRSQRIKDKDLETPKSHRTVYPPKRQVLANRM